MQSSSLATRAAVLTLFASLCQPWTVTGGTLAAGQPANHSQPRAASRSAGRAEMILAVNLAPDDAGKDKAADKEEKPKTEKPKDDLMKQVLEAAQGGDLAKVVKVLEKALKEDPENLQALSLLARVKENQAMEVGRPGSSPMLLEAASLTRRFLRLTKEPTEPEKQFAAQVFYNEACTYAVTKEPEKAIATLSEAFKMGFVQSDVMETDEELDSLRDRPEFKKLLKEIEAKAVPLAREHAKQLLADNKPFPFAFRLPGLDGKKVSLDDLKGKVAIVDVWGTWCPPCRQEIPHFVKLYERYHDKGLEIVGLNYERVPDDQIKETIEKFVKKNEVPYRCLIGDDKTQEQIPDFEGFPTTLFIGRDGKVRLKVVGYHSLLDLDAIISILLDEKTQTP